MPLLGLYREVVRRRYETQTRADEIHRVVCVDDVHVFVKRFRPAPGTVPKRLPVLCVPGLGADSANFDAPAPYGLAPWLAEQGFDTWAVDLRGTGLSKIDRKRWSSITFDDFIDKDMPAVLDHVAAVTSVPRLLWLGHSMGGLVLYALLAKGLGARVHAGAVLASPLGFTWDSVPLLRPLKGLGDLVPGLHVGEMSRLLAPFALRFDHPLAGAYWLKQFMVLENIDPAFARRLMYRAVQSIPRGLMLQFRDWLDHDAFRSADKAVDYRAGIDGCTTPMLVVGAPRDGLARVEAVERATALLKNATWLRAGKASGLSVDYGHIDLLFGKRAPHEIWPRVRAFLAQHDARDARHRLALAHGAAA